MDPKSGFNRETKIYRSLRPPVPLPPPHHSLSLTQYALSFLLSSAADLSSTTFLVNADADRRLSYSQFLHRVHSLSTSLLKLYPLKKNDVAFILSPASLHIPVLYFSLLSLGVTISPANPLGSESEISHQIKLSKPVIAFATSQAAQKIPKLLLGTVLVDSPEFILLINPVNDYGTEFEIKKFAPVEVKQSDPAAILYSSGTTGRIKGVLLTHRNFISVIAGFQHLRYLSVKNEEEEPHPVSLFTLPLFHVFGFFMFVRVVSNGETLVFMERFNFEGMLKAVEKYKVTYMPVSPPLVVALVKSDMAKKYNLSSLRVLGCGGSTLGKDVVDAFSKKFPNADIVQGYGLTESAGAGTRMIGPDESKRHGSVGRLAENTEAKIVDPLTGDALPPGKKGELWLRGPTLMKGYVGNAEATAGTLDQEGWLKTGDLCYFDSEGFLYIVDRLKELIKYKAYQVPPAELEHILQTNPEIADAAVIPYPDEEAGQIPMAYVVRKGGSNINEAQIIDYVAKQVAPYKRIRRVAFINSIPKSPAGKILRRELISHALSSNSVKL